MFYYLKIMLRNLRRNFTYSTVNITGLAVGITASVLIFLWVHHERTFDTCYPDVEQIYMITISSEWDGEMEVSASTSLPFIKACETEIPEIESIAFCYTIEQTNAATVNNTVFSVKYGSDIANVNKAWLEMFNNQLLEGSFEAFGNNPFSVALTESGSKKYFGDKQATGQVIRINNVDYTVQAVVKDNPTNSSFRYHIMASTDAVLSDTRLSRNMEQWGWQMWTTFVKLRSDADVPQVVQKMNDIIAKNNRQEEDEAGLQLLTDVYFSEDIDAFAHGNAKMVSIFSLLGILLIFTACINYVNLTTARVTQRLKEVGVKKIVGAKCLSLFFQFIAESLLISFIATLVALFLIQLVSPLYQSLVSLPISFSSPVIWVITGISLIFITFINGIYPALTLSSFQAINILKGISFSKIKNSSLRKILSVFQFALSAALIICVIVIFKQTHYIQNTAPGFSKDHIIRIELPFRTLMSSGQEQASLSLQTIKGKLQSHPNIVSVSLSNNFIENNRTRISGSADWNGREDFDPIYSILKVDDDYLHTFELQLTEGRWFDDAVDMQNVILNETAVRELKIHEPNIGQRFDLMGMKGNIIGIVKDFHFRSMHEKITPLIIYKQDPFCSVLAIKTHEGKSVEVVSEMEAIWAEFFPNDPFNYIFLDDAYNHLYQSDNRTLRLILVFSILAVLIAVLGLFGLSTFAIERRTKEIGIRKVMGASVSNIVHLLTREFLVLVTVAFIIAAPLSWWVMSNWLENFAYRIELSWWIFAVAALIVIPLALFAVGFQTIKAAIANPVNSIKNN